MKKVLTCGEGSKVVFPLTSPKPVAQVCQQSGTDFVDVGVRIESHVDGEPIDQRMDRSMISIPMTTR